MTKGKVTPGQPTKYNPKYCKMLIDYFAVPHYEMKGLKIKSAELPQFTAFARTIGVSRSTLHNWSREHPEFLDAYMTARQLQEELIANNAMCNRYNPTFAMFMLKNCHGWKDKQEIEQTAKVEINIDNDDAEL